VTARISFSCCCKTLRKFSVSAACAIRLITSKSFRFADSYAMGSRFGRFKVVVILVVECIYRKRGQPRGWAIPWSTNSRDLDGSDRPIHVILMAPSTSHAGCRGSLRLLLTLEERLRCGMMLLHDAPFRAALSCHSIG
jgi:hypothetical protein